MSQREFGIFLAGIAIFGEAFVAGSLIIVGTIGILLGGSFWSIVLLAFGVGVLILTIWMVWSARKAIRETAKAYEKGS